MADLRPKQRRFVDEYLVDLNATAAYRRAGYRARNDNVAAASASALLRNRKVAEAVAEALRARSVRTQTSRDSVLRGLMHEAEGRGQGSSPSARVRALELLGKHLGLFKGR
jgi:phage terminase small subunit